MGPRRSAISLCFRRSFSAGDYQVGKESQKDSFKVSVMGSGNWGSVVSRIVGKNVKKWDEFDDRVRMFVHEETVNGQKLSEIINETHYNVKYLPRHQLPSNVVAVPDAVEAAKDADILVFVIPHQFVRGLCTTLSGKVKPTAIGVTLIKGLEVAEGGGIEIISQIINRSLNIEMSTLMGANIANEIAEENFCEATLGCRDKQVGARLKNIFQTEYYRVVVVDDALTVELCGALKNIVACAAGFVDGMEMGSNTKAAVVRLGLYETVKFIETFFPGSKITTYLESCGIADMITTCYGGSRNRRVAEEFVRTGRPLYDLEKEMLNGQKLQGVSTALDVNFMLKNKNRESEFPLLTAVHKICTQQMRPDQLIEAIKIHPAHM